MPHVYLLHFDQKLHHAQHYLGWTSNGVESRLETHLKGNGSRLVKAVVDLGRAVSIARVWEHDNWQGARAQERRMKRTNHLPSYCPICSKERKSRAK